MLQKLQGIFDELAPAFNFDVLPGGVEETFGLHLVVLSLREEGWTHLIDPLSLGLDQASSFQGVSAIVLDTVCVRL